MGTVHKWLGENDLHGQISLMSFGWLKGAVPSRNGLRFPNGAQWFISFFDKNATIQLIQGLFSKPEVFYGMFVQQTQLIPDPEFKHAYRFLCASPILLRQNRNDTERDHIIWSDSTANELLTRTLSTRLYKANRDDLLADLELSFDRQYPKAQTKLVHFKESKLKTSWCPIIAKGSPEALAFIWNVGLGELTGSGFGAVY